MKINCNVNTKANPIVAHKYVFKAFDNDKAPEDEQAYVLVKHLTTKTLQKYMYLNEDGRPNMDSCAMFLGQVTKVEHVFNTVAQRDMTKEEIVESQANVMLMTLVNELAAHLFEEVNLNKAEEKN